MATAEEKKYYKEYYRKNKEQKLKLAKEYYDENKDMILNKKREYNKNYLRSYNKKYQEKNKSKIKENKQIYTEKNKSKIKENKQIYYLNNKEYFKSKNLEYRINNRELINKKQKEKREINTLFKLSQNIRSLISKSIRRKGYKKYSKTEQILGCSYEEFKIHLEAQWESWMSWDNYGLYNGTENYGWDIDHIIPVSSAINEEGMITLNHYTNLQPLCSYNNRDIKKATNICSL